jgi:hypothetical protein
VKINIANITDNDFINFFIKISF